MIRFITKSEEETALAGGTVAKQLRKGDIVALNGELGAGKTTFAAGVASVLAPKAEAASPTFALVNVYGGDVPIYHMDLYRLAGADDVWSIGLDDYFDESGICLIEWSERAVGLAPNITVDIMAEDENTRVITVCGVELC